jgi:hypothetical protein
MSQNFVARPLPPQGPYDVTFTNVINNTTLQQTVDEKLEVKVLRKEICRRFQMPAAALLAYGQKMQDGDVVGDYKIPAGGFIFVLPTFWAPLPPRASSTAESKLKPEESDRANNGRSFHISN